MPATKRKKITLHAAIQSLLIETGHALTLQEIADALNKSNGYRKRDGSPIKASQIRARVNQYPHLFDSEGSLVYQSGDLEKAMAGLDIFMDFFEVLADEADNFRKKQKTWLKRYIQSDVTFISDFLTNQLIIENLIERDLKNAIPSTWIRKKWMFNDKINALKKDVHLLYPYCEIFKEIRDLRNNLVHKLNYQVTEKDYQLLKHWYINLQQSTSNDNVIKMYGLFTHYCLFTIELKEDPMEKFSRSVNWKFKKARVATRKKAISNTDSN